jgi:hypothetical protein
MFDLFNQYMTIAESSGLILLIFFVAIIVIGCKHLGMAMKLSQGNRRQELFIWAMGSAMFANVVAFFGISYFDQTIVAWYALLAMISVVTLAARKAQAEPQPALARTKSNLGFRPQLTPNSTQGRLSN